jgi:nucleoside-triphosphatase THEP1
VSSKLILIKGLSGAGKSRTAVNIGEQLLQRGLSCAWFLDEDEGHPIDCTGFALTDLSKKLIPLWKSFIDRVADDQTITIIESR